MVTRAYFARRFLALKVLRGALIAGALYDAAVAGTSLWHPAAAARLLGPVSIDSPTLAALVAIWLLMLAGLELAAARDVRRYSAVIAALVCGRAAAAIVVATGALVGATQLPWPAVWNALLAATLGAAWWPQRP